MVLLSCIRPTAEGLKVVIPGPSWMARGLNGQPGLIGLPLFLQLAPPPRLQDLGFIIPKEKMLLEQQLSLAWQLYRLLEKTHGNATHSVYSALQQEINSFACAAELFLCQQQQSSNPTLD